MTERDIKTPENPAQDDPEKALLALFVNKFGQTLIEAYLLHHRNPDVASGKDQSNLDYEFVWRAIPKFHDLTADLRRSYRRGAISLDDLARELDHIRGHGRISETGRSTGMHSKLANFHGFEILGVMLPDFCAPERQNPDQVGSFANSNATALKEIDDRTHDPERSLLLLFVKNFGELTMSRYVQHYLEQSVGVAMMTPIFERLHEHTAGLRRAYRSGELSYDDLARQLPEIRETMKAEILQSFAATPILGERLFSDLFRPEVECLTFELKEMIERYGNPLSLIDRMNPSRSQSPRER